MIYSGISLGSRLSQQRFEFLVLMQSKGKLVKSSKTRPQLVSYFSQ